MMLKTPYPQATIKERREWLISQQCLFGPLGNRHTCICRCCEKWRSVWLATEQARKAKDRLCHQRHHQLKRQQRLTRDPTPLSNPILPDGVDTNSGI